jgi:NAD(P)-dependent dehydrogenase (short-subunit alcohol dehydrogenase family)
MTNTETRSAIVTGASGGIGRAVAGRLAKDGFAIAVNYAGNRTKAQEVVSEIKAAGGKAMAIHANVTNAADVESLFSQTLQQFGRIDVVVNSACIMPLLPIADGDLETFDKAIATNLRGTFLVLGQAVGRFWRARGELCADSPARFREPAPPTAKETWNFAGASTFRRRHGAPDRDPRVVHACSRPAALSCVLDVEQTVQRVDSARNAGCDPKRS